MTHDPNEAVAGAGGNAGDMAGLFRTKGSTKTKSPKTKANARRSRGKRKGAKRR